MQGVMPFDRYLQLDTQEGSSNHHGYDDHRGGEDPYGGPSSSGAGPSSASMGSVQFQLPPFMYSGPPALAPGGGAEVLPTAMFAQHGSMSDSWLANPSFPSYDTNAPSADTHDRDYEPSSALSAVFDPAGQPWANPENVAAAAAALAGPQSWAAPSALGLPVYSQSGFDLLSVLGRVVNRTSPKIQLGPVDMTCAFVVSDTRRYDSPIVYASPTFCALTGYAEHEILGRNCRFLQAPDGRVQKGEERRYTAPDAVSHMRKCLSADKECQTSLVNYKKGGQAFINLVTMIPVFGGVNDSAEERDTVVYHVGFQVDLTQQPNAILQRLKDGSYIVNYSSSSPIAPAAGPGGRRTQASAPLVPMSNDLRRLLADDSFIRSLPLSTSVNAVHNAERADAYDDHQLLHMLLLEALPDFVHVLSLKGVFLYAAPSVRRVLGYEPSELVGRSIADFCHPADLVPLMRELKESSTAQSLAEAGAGVNSNVQTGVQSVQAILAGSGGGPPKTVDLLFRCKSKGGEYVWLDCRGRLHVEAGKGRKAIIMSGRQRGLPQLAWGQIEQAGGLMSPAPGRPASPNSNSNMSGHANGDDDEQPEDQDRAKSKSTEREFWAELSVTGTVLFVGAGARDVMGWGAGELIGRPVGELIEGHEAKAALEHALGHAGGFVGTRTINCMLVRRDGVRTDADIVVYPVNMSSSSDTTHFTTPTGPTTLTKGQRAPPPCVVQIRVARGYAPPPPAPLAHPPQEHLFVELDVGRETSWQYELQQLKYANRRLADAVEALEAEALEGASGNGNSGSGSGSGSGASGTGMGGGMGGAGMGMGMGMGNSTMPGTIALGEEWRGTKRAREDGGGEEG